MVDAIDEMACANVREFALALYAAHRFDTDPTLSRGKHYYSYPAHWFYGTQCCIYTRQVASDLADFISLHGTLKNDAPYDILAKEYFCAWQNVYTTHPSLVQHVGWTSSGLGAMHQSPAFGMTNAKQ
jgi:hypothetical protein